MMIVIRSSYRAANSMVRKEIKKAKEEFLLAKCQEIQQGFENNNSKVAYEVVKQLTKEKTTKVPVIEDANGKLLTETGKIQKRWNEYAKDLYNYPISTTEEILTTLEQEGPGPDEVEEPEILRSEIVEAVKKLKNGKAAGFDNLTAELIRNGGEMTIEVLHKICNSVWRNKEWPTQWTKSLIVPLPKKGDLKKCNNYRTISLINSLKQSSTKGHQ